MLARPGIAVLFVAAMSCPLPASVLVVRPDGTGDHTEIQAAIDAVEDDGVVFVHPAPDALACEEYAGCTPLPGAPGVARDPHRPKDRALRAMIRGALFFENIVARAPAGCIL